MDKKTKQLLVKTLAELYPQPRSELNFSNPYQMIVCVLLSAQCTDKKVNEVTPKLFAHYPTFDKLGAAKLEDIEAIIRPINYYKTKARNLLLMAQKVSRDFKGELPQTLEELITLPGVGQKTANVVLCEQGVLPAFPVDTHVFRVSKRLGLAQAATPEKVEEELKLQFEPGRWRDLHHSLVLHGRRVCKAPRPLCDQCALNKICPRRGVP